MEITSDFINIILHITKNAEYDVSDAIISFLKEFPREILESMGKIQNNKLENNDHIYRVNFYGDELKLEIVDRETNAIRGLYLDSEMQLNCDEVIFREDRFDKQTNLFKGRNYISLFVFIDSKKKATVTYEKQFQFEGEKWTSLLGKDYNNMFTKINFGKDQSVTYSKVNNGYSYYHTKQRENNVVNPTRGKNLDRSF